MNPPSGSPGGPGGTAARKRSRILCRRNEIAASKTERGGVATKTSTAAAANG